ncbi:hypothetical protein N302_15029, partial [Corvus brachyrhynchos]
GRIYLAGMSKINLNNFKKKKKEWLSPYRKNWSFYTWIINILTR